MADKITLEVGDLYAQLHERFRSEIGEQYDEQVRQTLETFLHEFNQQIERQSEQVQSEEVQLSPDNGEP